MTMGQSIVVNAKPSSNPGVVRFETNRLLTGMDHERYLAGQDVWGERPPDELARRLFDLGNVAGVHVHGNMITVDLNKGFGADGILEVIEDLYRFYPDVEDAPAEETTAEEPVAEAAPAEEPVAEETSAEESPAEESPAEESPAEEPEATADSAEPEGS